MKGKKFQVNMSHVPRSKDCFSSCHLQLYHHMKTNYPVIVAKSFGYSKFEDWKEKDQKYVFNMQRMIRCGRLHGYLFYYS